MASNNWVSNSPPKVEGNRNLFAEQAQQKAADAYQAAKERVKESGVPFRKDATSAKSSAPAATPL